MTTNIACPRRGPGKVRLRELVWSVPGTFPVRENDAEEETA